MGIKKTLLTGLAAIVLSSSNTNCVVSVNGVPLNDTTTYKPRPYDVLPEQKKKSKNNTWLYVVGAIALGGASYAIYEHNQDKDDGRVGIPPSNGGGSEGDGGSGGN